MIQALVIPWVNRRSRRRETWEEAVADLSNVVGDEVPSVTARLRHTGDDLRFWVLEARTFRIEEDRLAARIENAQSDHRQAEAAAIDLLGRIKRNAARVQRLRRRAPYWVALRTRLTLLEIAITVNAIGWTSAEHMASKEDWDKQGIRLDRTVNELVEMVDDLWNRLAPPPFGLRERWRRFLAPRFRSVKLNAVRLGRLRQGVVASMRAIQIRFRALGNRPSEASAKPSTQNARHDL
jgi:hypothetical protein